jgi:PhoPQ-activated pathogenicity-related protein
MLRRSFLCLLALACWAGDDSALDRYLRAPDPAYRYELLNSARLPGLTIHTLEMVSQRWLTEAEVDRPEWRHWLIVYQPDTVEHRTGLLLINGGANSSKPPSSPDPLLSLLAAESKSVVADLKMVPNQPLLFNGAEAPRTEDALIAWTWKKFLETGDERWPARLPMTKAAVRAMDTVTAFCASIPDRPVKVERFVVAGGSKRGWTTWTTAAVDRRVTAIIPMVIDTLNVDASFTHHFRAYGFWAPAIQDYSAASLMQWLGTPEWRRLMEIEDPWEYRDRLAIPKLIVNSSGDQFFLPDSSQFYFDGLPGEKFLRYVPNTDHSLNTLELPPDLLAYYQAFLTCTPRPRFSWKADRSAGTLRLKSLDEPTQVLLWEATNPEARDFRHEKIGKAWKSSPVTGENGIYAVQPAPPAQGFTAFFLEMTFPGPAQYPFRFTTEVVVTPGVYPFEAPVPAAAQRPE